MRQDLSTCSNIENVVFGAKFSSIWTHLFLHHFAVCYFVKIINSLNH